MMTPSAAITRNAENNQKRPVTSIVALSLAVRRVSGLVGADHRFVTLAHGQELVLAHDVLAAILHVVLVEAREDDGVHRARFFAEAAVDALEEVDVVARGTARAVC